MADKGATLDMSLFFGTPEEKKFFCTELLRLLKARGGVKIQNHSIPDEDIHELFDMVSLHYPERNFLNVLTISFRAANSLPCLSRPRWWLSIPPRRTQPVDTVSSAKKMLPTSVAMRKVPVQGKHET
jgi:hypothetical protein